MTPVSQTTSPATALGLLLWAQRSTPQPEEEIADAIADLHAGWSDERKADLYALMAESIGSALPESFGGLVLKLDACYSSNERWAARHG
jgi:hypothetical protein